MMGLKKKVGIGVLAGALMLVLTAGVALALNRINCASLEQSPFTPECNGTPQNDAIEGRDAPDIIYARAGDDSAAGHIGNDVVYAGAGIDYAHGDEGDDQLYGARGADHLTDEAYPVQGGDTDEQQGGRGNDILSGYDQDYNDTLVCGGGTNDTVYFDKSLTTTAKDTVSSSCEQKYPNVSDGF